RFIRDFEEEYNVEPNTIPFFENGYAQAFDLAKRDLKYLLVILLSPEHDDTAPFVRDTLLSPQIKEFIQNHVSDMIVWAGSVQDSEAYQVANALNVTKFPFTGLIVHTPLCLIYLHVTYRSCCWSCFPIRVSCQDARRHAKARSRVGRCKETAF
ncbi:hypothetical protein KCU67_g16549, partial [Aureobasidium melanogenum]